MGLRAPEIACLMYNLGMKIIISKNTYYPGEINFLCVENCLGSHVSICRVAGNFHRWLTDCSLEFTPAIDGRRFRPRTCASSHRQICMGLWDMSPTHNFPTRKGSVLWVLLLISASPGPDLSLICCQARLSAVGKDGLSCSRSPGAPWLQDTELTVSQATVTTGCRSQVSSHAMYSHVLQ